MPASLTILVATALAASPNLALRATPRSWLPTSRPSPYAPLANLVDGDPTTFWTSTDPTSEPPKDVGLEWPAPLRVGSLVARFYSVGYLPAPDGWRVEVRCGGAWQSVQASVDRPHCEWWTLRFDPVETDAVRLVVTRYARTRPSLTELEAYETVPPAPAFRRSPLLDGAFMSFQYRNWATRFATDDALAKTLVAARDLGLRTIFLYTLNGQRGQFSTVVPDTVLDQTDCWVGRDPVEALLRQADQLELEVYLGDILPHCIFAAANPAEQRELEARLTRYREQMLRRYLKHKSLAGYYLNHECDPRDTRNDPAEPAAMAESAAALAKRLAPRLRTVQPVGFYPWLPRGAKVAAIPKPAELRAFWDPFMAAAKSVDIYLAIDGVGTGLAPLGFTDVDQGALRELCERHGKALWTDVECADFGDYSSMPMDRLAASIEVAAKHAERLVTFDFLNYMSPDNGREGSQRLHDEYVRYRALIRPGG
ncbi:MAG: DUF4434 domain-containing protein [Armatimonadetes bacterium]|nr:DUF4434 domain-containing protein [Armatimonadota bacterium]